MADLAVLGLQIESDGAVTASANLDKLTASAAKAEKATDSAGKASEQASQRMGAGSKAVERLLQAIEKVEKAVRDQNAALGNMGGAMARAEAQMEAASKAAQSVAASVTGAGTASSAAAAQVATLATSGNSAAAGMAATSVGAAKLGASLQAANQNIALTRNQLLNLSRQGNDAFTMFFSGSSITQIFATQIGQVYGALEEGPGGLRGSLKALGSSIMGLINPTTLAIAGFGAAALAVRYFGDNTASNMEKAEKAAKSYASTVGKLRTAQGDLSKTMDAIFDRETISSTEQMRRELALLAKEQVAAKKALADNLLTAGTPGILEGLNPFRNARELYRMGTDATSASDLGKLAGEFERNERSAASLREELEKLKLSDDLPSDLQTIVDKMLDGARQAEQVEARIKAITTAIREQKREIATANYTKASDAFASFLPDTRTSRQQVQEAYYKRVEAIRQLQDNPRAMEGRQATADADRLTALREIERQEEVSRKGRDLDIASVSARTTAERALLAAQRERLALTEPGANKAEVEQKALSASTQVYAEAERDAADALRQSQSAREQAGLEGYAAQVAAINTQYAEQIRLADGSAAAVEALRQARALDIEALDISTRKSLLGDQEEQIRTLREEASMIGVNDEARRLALVTLRAESDLRRQGIDLNSEWGQSYVANARQIETLETAIDKQTESFEDMRDASSEFFMSLGNGKGILENLANAFEQFGKKLASQGFDKIFGNLFGAAGQGGSTGAGIVSSLSQTVSQGAPSYSAGSLGETYAAPLGQVTRAALPPIVTGEGFSASKAASVAGQSVPARMWNFFASKGLAAHQIAGILGNAKAESAFNPTAVGDSGQAYGLFQWNDRKGNLFNNIGGRSNLGNVDAQLDFAWKELQTSESKAYRALLKATDVTQATEAFLGFERPQGYNTGVRNSHNYSGRVANSKELYNQFAGGSENVASSTNDTRELAKGVSAGVVDANRKIASNYDLGGYDAGGANSQAGAGASGNGIAGRLQNLLKSPFGQGAMNALGAFGAGVSGGPISGALTGGLGAIGMGLGPVGIAAGIGAGILGSLAKNLFNKKEREAKHREQAATWANMQPDYLKWQESIQTTMPTSGLSDYFAEQTANFDKFRETGGAAWKYGKNNSTQDFVAVGTAMYQQFTKIREAFRETVDPMIAALNAGRGMDSPFADARNQIVALGQQLNLFIEDTEEAYWTLPDQAAKVAEATEAARQQLIKSFDVAEPLSAIGEEMQRLDGAAVGAKKVLMDLGDSAEVAGAIIDEKLGPAIARVGENLTKELQAQLEDLDGKGYLGDFRSLVDEDAQRRKDISTYNLAVDPTLVDAVFKKSAQSIVNGAELTGDAFADLVEAFPALSGVVSEFDATLADTASAVTRTAAELKDAVAGYDDRYFAATNTSSLADFERRAQKERETEAAAGGAAMAQLERTLEAERSKILNDGYQSFLNDRLTDAISARADAESNLRSEYERTADRVSGISDFLRGMALADTSPLSGKEQFEEAQRNYRDTLAKADGGDVGAQEELLTIAQEYRDASRAYNASSEADAAVYREIQSSLQASAAKMETELGYARQQASFLGEISEGTKGLNALMKEFLEAQAKQADLQKQMDGNRSFGLNPERNRMIDTALKGVGLNYTGNYGLTNGADQFLNWRTSLPAEQLAVVNGIIGQYIGINRQSGGLIPGYAMGGMVGNGIYNQDSVLARYAGGGAIGLAGGEMVISAPKVTPQTYPVLDAINRTGRVPANDTVRMNQVENLLRTLIATTGGGLQRVAETGEQGNRSSEQMALAARRGVSNKQAA